MAGEGPIVAGEIPPMFTPEQINAVLAMLEENPGLVKTIISSGQGGNEEDLMFMLESKRGFWTDVEVGGKYVT